MSNNTLAKGGSDHPVILEELQGPSIRKYLQVTIADFELFLKENKLSADQLFGIPIGVDSVEFDIAMRKKVRELYGR